MASAKAEALLGHIHAQHARQSDRQTTGANGFREMWPDKLLQHAPRRHVVDLDKETVTPGQLFLGCVFEVRKLSCMAGSAGNERVNIASVRRAAVNRN